MFIGLFGTGPYSPRSYYILRVDCGVELALVLEIFPKSGDSTMVPGDFLDVGYSVDGGEQVVESFRSRIYGTGETRYIFPPAHVSQDIVNALLDGGRLLEFTILPGGDFEDLEVSWSFDTRGFPQAVEALLPCKMPPTAMLRSPGSWFTRETDGDLSLRLVGIGPLPRNDYILEAYCGAPISSSWALALVEIFPKSGDSTMVPGGLSLDVGYRVDGGKQVVESFRSRIYGTGETRYIFPPAHVSQDIVNALRAGGRLLEFTMSPGEDFEDLETSWSFNTRGFRQALLGLASCKAQQDGPLPDDTRTSECVSSFRQAHSIEALMAETDVVFIGVPTGATEEIWVQGDQDLFGIGTLREYRVERYLDGDGPDLVNVLQYYHTREYRVGGALHRCVNSSATDYAPPVKGERYLLYLKTHPRLPNVFFAFYEPSRFSLKNGSVIPDSPWELATRAFPPDVEQTVLSKIAAVRND